MSDLDARAGDFVLVSIYESQPVVSREDVLCRVVHVGASMVLVSIDGEPHTFGLDEVIDVVPRPR